MAPEQLQVRVRPGGEWHRHESIDDGSDTACGLPIGAHASRFGGVDDLCEICFTPSEIQTGRIARLKLEYEDETGDLYFDPDDEPTYPGTEDDS